MGYHLREITKGVLGESSKIQEELFELQDAEAQENKILAIVELSDLYGAVRSYLEKHYPVLTMKDLEKMADATRRAFEDGTRN